jgi:outer membrane protein OmpA-like peptidoglycan-associated protein
MHCIGIAMLLAACGTQTPTSTDASLPAGAASPAAGSHQAGATTSSAQRAAESSVVIATVIHFPPDVATPPPRVASLLDEVADILRANPSVRVEIGGHADRAEDEGVAHARANLVASSLAARGVPRTRVEVTSYGYRRPAADGRHGRVQFQVLPGR